MPHRNIIPINKPTKAKVAFNFMECVRILFFRRTRVKFDGFDRVYLIRIKRKRDRIYDDEIKIK